MTYIPDFDRGPLLRLEVEIRDTLTGAIAKFQDEKWYNLDTARFHWEENNGSCDCVRAEYFPLDEEVPCNVGKNRFQVRLSWQGERVFSEGEDV